MVILSSFLRAARRQPVRTRGPALLLALVGATMLARIGTARADAALVQRPAVQTFISRMVEKHGFSKSDLDKLFGKVKIQQTIIDAMNHPAEHLPWYRYRKIFLTESRIQSGLKFWDNNHALLSRIASRYGVPPEIIVAILGVETRYGARTGSYRVIDSLSTLAFDYPPRGDYFQRELESFLLLTRQEKANPLQELGSYAGAMGMPQFMPSSYNTYAVDFDADGKRNLWSDTADAAASVANYFLQHGWQTGQPVTVQATVDGNGWQKLTSGGLKPDTTYGKLAAAGVKAKSTVASDQPVSLITLDDDNGQEHWLAMQNFYVITRYNHSPLYAMAVYQLGEAIRARRQGAD